MNPWLSVREKVPGKFRVGDRVRMLHGFKGIIAEVVEDRGRLGVGGSRFYGVKFRVDEWNEFTTELPEESLEAVPPEPRKKRKKGTKRKKDTPLNPPATPEASSLADADHEDGA